MYLNFSSFTPDGNTLSLSELVGKTDYLLIDFWASWCGPCLRSFPELTKFYNEHKGERFEILGVSLDNKDQNWKKAIDQYELAWQHVSDLQGWSSESAQLYTIQFIPQTVLLNKEGKIIGKNMSLDEMKEMIKK